MLYLEEHSAEEILGFMEEDLIHLVSILQLGKKIESQTGDLLEKPSYEATLDYGISALLRIISRAETEEGIISLSSAV